MELNLEELHEAMIHFSSIQSKGFTENCIVALENQNHKSGAVLSLSGDKEDLINLNWVSIVNKNGYKETKKFTEKGAEALSFFLALNLTEYDVVEEASIGTGIDYWLGYKEDDDRYDEYNFISARLEVSGILKESGGNTVEARTKIKNKQTESSESTGLPVYISIVEFSNPKAYFAKK